MSQSKLEPRVRPKRFYRAVAVAEVADGYGITLDGKALKTPARQPLVMKSRALAEALAAEWDAQTEVINADAMPLMRLTSIAIDRVGADRAELLADIARYVETDLLLYRAPSTGEGAALAARQAAVFDPLLAWVREAHGAAFVVTEGVMPIPQSSSALATISTVFAEATDSELAALAMMVPMLGSALLALALWKQRVTVAEAMRLARLDEEMQAEQWGVDPLAAAAWDAKCVDIQAAAFFLDNQAV